MLKDSATKHCYDKPVAPCPLMSEEQLNTFVEKVKSDTEFQEKLKAAGSNEAALQIAKDAGFAITAEDIQSMQSATVEVSDEELEGASGGLHGWEPEWPVFDMPVFGDTGLSN